MRSSDVLTHIVCFLAPGHLKNFCLGFLENMGQYKHIKWDTYVKQWHEVMIENYFLLGGNKFGEACLRHWLPKIEAQWNEEEDFILCDCARGNILLRCIEFGFQETCKYFLYERRSELPPLFSDDIVYSAVTHNRPEVLALVSKTFLVSQHVAEDTFELACLRGYLDIITIFIERYNETCVPVTKRCFQTPSAQIMKLLLKCSSTHIMEHSISEVLRPVFYNHIGIGNLKMVEVLLGDPRCPSPDEDDNLPLRLACENNDTKMIALLMKNEKVSQNCTMKNYDQIYGAFERNLKKLKRVP